MKPIVDEIQRLITQGEPFALATVITRNGSAPRSAGAKMLVKKDGGILGTVGGGILEAQVQDLAARMIVERGATVQDFHFSGKDAATMDAICGGMVDVLVEWVDPGNPQTAAVFHALQEAISRHRKSWLVTVLPENQSSTTHALVLSDGEVIGTLPDGLALETILESRQPNSVECRGYRAMIEPVNIDGTAYIFGAGHVSRSLAEFTKAVGFWTVVLDDRSEWANQERFPFADEVIVLDSFEDGLGKIPVDRDSYIVIVTRGHLNDRTVLAQVLRSDAGYIGMIGSRRKCELIFQELRQTGFTETDIQRVHAPIGMEISAETPEEIGISIVAEMIQVRVQNRQALDF